MGGRRGHRSVDIATVVSGLLRALSICTPVGFLDSPPTLAEPFEPTVLAAEIPAGPLAEALATFARQTGLHLVYVSDVVRNRKSHEAAAGLSPDAALARLLQGTGLRFEYLTPRSIRILAVEVAPRQSTPNPPVRDELREVIVTANRREEDLQNVPVTIQVLTDDALAKLNARTFDDFVTYLPGLTAHGVGPGQSNIYVRGLGAATGGIQSSGVVEPFPNVAVYLDEQSAQLPGRNLDIYAADLERIEILEGPQGTLFGAGAQAGVIRYITNKPRLNVMQATVNAGYATTAHGEQSSNLDATINIPLIADHLAVRGVIYNDQRGGYIDNLPATFARAQTDLGSQFFAPGTAPVNTVVLNNFNLAARDVNPVTYRGLRLEALYRFNEDWDALLAQSYQSIEADGVFAEMAANSLGQPQPDLSAQLYNPSHNKDRFENTALTIDGRLGGLKLVYAGTYLVRNVDQLQDYTNYARATYAEYYQCAANANYLTAPCFTPSSTWRDLERNTHQSHELRVSTSAAARMRAIGGLFYEDYRIQEQTDWFYLSALAYYNPIGPPTGYYTLNGSQLQPDGTAVRFFTQGAVFVPGPVTSNNPNVRPSGDAFFNDITRGYKQHAAYISIDYDLVPKKLTLTAGTRYSRTATSEVGSSVGSFGCELIVWPSVPNPCVNHSIFTDLNAENLHRTFSGFRSRVNLSWRVADDALLYYTWSQGFRAGGFNRTPFPSLGNSPLATGSYSWQAQANVHKGWVAPLDIAPDDLTNNELGWKTMWLDRRIQWNGAIYREDWNRAQINVFGLGLIASGVTLNGGDYRVRGFETSVVARIAHGLTIEAAAAWNHSELVKEAAFMWADGTPIDFNTLHNSSGDKVVNPGGALGSPLAGAPPFQGNIRVRYDFAIDGYDALAQIGAVHQSHSLATTARSSVDLQGKSTAYDLPAFTTYDAALGVGKDAWLVQVYAENLTDTRAQLYANYTQYYKAITVSRPRTIGLQLSYNYRQ
jgi:iron complex outermembrane receptor protein